MLQRAGNRREPRVTPSAARPVASRTGEPRPGAGPYLLVPVAARTRALGPPARAAPVHLGRALARRRRRRLQRGGVAGGGPQLGLAAGGGRGPPGCGQGLRAVAAVAVLLVLPLAVRGGVHAPQGRHPRYLVALGALAAVVVLVHRCPHTIEPAGREGGRRRGGAEGGREEGGRDAQGAAAAPAPRKARLPPLRPLGAPGPVGGGGGRGREGDGVTAR